MEQDFVTKESDMGFPKMSLGAERRYPYTVGGAAGVAWLVIRLYFLDCDVDFQDSLLSAGITYGSIAIGFLCTTMAVTISIGEAPLMEDIKESGYIIELTQYIFEAIFVSLATVVIGFIGFAPISSSIAYQAMWFTAMVSSCATFIRIAIIFYYIFRKLRPM
jgi:hypothetical protein